MKNTIMVLFPQPKVLNPLPFTARLKPLIFHILAFFINSNKQNINCLQISIIKKTKVLQTAKFHKEILMGDTAVLPNQKDAI